MWRRRRRKKICSVMPAHGPTAPPQMSQLGLREDADQIERGRRQLALLLRDVPAGGLDGLVAGWAGQMLGKVACRL